MGTSRWLKVKLTVACALAVATSGAFAGQITLYGQPAFQGQSMTTTMALPSLERSSFNDVASSVVVRDGTWEACTETNFRGRCAQLVPGAYSRVDRDLNGRISSVRQIAYEPAAGRIVLNPDAQPVVVGTAPAPVVISPGANPVVISPAPVVVNTEPREVIVAPPVVNALPIPAGARITLYNHRGHMVRAVELTSNIDDLDTRRFDDLADAALVSGGIWRLCDSERGRGNCTDYPPGQYESLGGLDGKVRSAYLIAPVPDRVIAVSGVPPGRAVLYEFANFGGPSAVVEYGRAPDLSWANFRHPASSARIESGSWLVCTEMGYQGECQVLEPGEYPTLSGLGQGIASARQVWRPEYGAVVYRR